ncbi:MAG: 30S ribosomal protein S16 [Maribacter sp.]|nr:30S ribosomal protein S16 [Maribacter sp.]
MPVKIRLQRHGKKGKPFYWIVAADSRAKRDGKFLEKLGIYNPNTNPATIELNIDNSVSWLQNGAQPSDTARAILSYKGALMKHHLLGGVRKGALTEEQMEAKFNAWLEEKEKTIASKVGGLDKAKADAKKKALAAEKEANEKRALAATTVEEPAETANETTVEEVKETGDAGAETVETVEEVVATPAAVVEEKVAAPAEEVVEIAEPAKEDTAKTESVETKVASKEAASGEEE